MSDSITLEISGRLYERFEEERETTANEPHAPAMDPKTFLSALLDTHKAARTGYYDNDTN